MTLTRAETPTHSPWGELYFDGVRASVEAATGIEQALGGEVLQRRRVLGEEHVGRRVCPLGDQLVGQQVLVVEAHVDVNARLPLERVDQGLGGLDVLAAVEGDRRRGGVGRDGSERRGREQARAERGAEQGAPHHAPGAGRGPLRSRRGQRPSLS